jgi:hypothetical protein
MDLSPYDKLQQGIVELISAGYTLHLEYIPYETQRRATLQGIR